MKTQINHEQRRTFTGPALSPTEHKQARKKALRLAREMGNGWEHRGGGICYVVERDVITRIESGPDGERLSERRIP